MFHLQIPDIFLLQNISRLVMFTQFASTFFDRDTAIPRRHGGDDDASFNEVDGSPRFFTQAVPGNARARKTTSLVTPADMFVRV